MPDTLQATPAQRASDAKAMEMFAHQWQLYRKILDHDYLGNDGAYAALQRFLADEIARPFHLLDLACGDAKGIAQTLSGLPISSYRGIDLATPALELARSNLKALPCPVTLEQADFSDAVRSVREPLDIVWISLSLHHLETPAKLQLMREIFGAMAPEGAFLIYEPARADGEGRPAYMDKFERIAHADWTALNPTELAEALEHVRTCDLPETITGWKTLGREAGFSRIFELYRSPDNLFRLVNYRR